MYAFERAYDPEDKSGISNINADAGFLMSITILLQVILDFAIIAAVVHTPTDWAWFIGIHVVGGILISTLKWFLCIALDLRSVPYYIHVRKETPKEVTVRYKTMSDCWYWCWPMTLLPMSFLLLNRFRIWLTTKTTSILFKQ
jgi:hypothetical protein